MVKCRRIQTALPKKATTTNDTYEKSLHFNAQRAVDSINASDCIFFTLFVFFVSATCSNFTTRNSFYFRLNNACFQPNMISFSCFDLNVRCA